MTHDEYRYRVWRDESWPVGLGQWRWEVQLTVAVEHDDKELLDRPMYSGNERTEREAVSAAREWIISTIEHAKAESAARQAKNEARWEKV